MGAREERGYIEEPDVRLGKEGYSGLRRSGVLVR